MITPDDELKIRAARILLKQTAGWIERGYEPEDILAGIEKARECVVGVPDEEWPPVECVWLRVIALHAGPVAAGPQG